MAQALAASLGLTAAAGSVVQANKVGHTRADGWHRLVTPALFTGEVVAGADDLLVDDHVGFGGTLANLRGFTEHNGGRVLGMTTLTETREARRIAIRNATENMLKAKRGEEFEQFWHGEFGHGINRARDEPLHSFRRDFVQVDDVKRQVAENVLDFCLYGLFVFSWARGEQEINV